MKRFEYRLQRVMEWRESQLEIELAGLGRVTAEGRAIDQRREEVEAERAAAEKSLTTAALVEAGQLAALDEFRVWAHQERERLIRKRAECEKRIEAQRKRVLEARRRFRLLERLKERKLAEWTGEFNRELENLAGELFLARRGRNAGTKPGGSLERLAPLGLAPCGVQEAEEFARVPGQAGE